MPIPRPSIILALSGGGFRATLFHLGVIRFLYENDRLNDLRAICSVSGGSIIAAHLALRWSSYSGPPDKFDEAASELVAFTRRDLRGTVMRRWFLRWHFLIWKSSRINLLCRLYRNLYRKKGLADPKLTDIPANAPDLHILATSFTTGGLVEIGSTHSSDGTVATGVRLYKEENRQFSQMGGLTKETFSLSEAVAASSAFPPLFPPLLKSADDLGFNAASGIPNQSLADGGVRDNLGIEFVQKCLKPEVNKTIVFVSDAGKPFDWDNQDINPYRWVTTRASRTADIQMKRLSDADLDEFCKLHPNWCVRCAIAESDTIPFADPKGDGLPIQRPFTKNTQRRIGQIRTDLNAFSWLEVHALVRHGYEVAKKAWHRDFEGGSAVPTVPTKIWSPANENGKVHITHEDVDSMDEKLKRSAQLKIGALTLFTIVGVMLAWAILVLGLFYSGWIPSELRSFVRRIISQSSNISAEQFAANVCKFADDATEASREIDGILNKTIAWTGKVSSSGQETYGGQAAPYLSINVAPVPGCNWEMRAFLDESYEAAREYVGQTVKIEGKVRDVNLGERLVKILDCKVTVKY